VRKYAAGEVILRKGDRATTVCEVLEGSAHPEHTTAIRYTQGQSFGSAGLISNQERTGSVIAEQDGAIIAFYNMQELSKINPAKARELYNEVMEDTLHVIAFLDARVDELEEQVAELKAKAAKAPAKASGGAGAKAKPKAKAKPAAKARRKP
jgi:CRP-like cAMP-binding protein